MMEGDKIIKDALTAAQMVPSQLIATPAWLKENHALLNTAATEIIEADIIDLSRITVLETPPPVIAVLHLRENIVNHEEVAHSLTIVLDSIQDPGNLGTIIRTADWFDIRNVICSENCADSYNPKVVQASMGAILNIGVHYMDLSELLERYSAMKGFTISGTFMEGSPVNAVRQVKPGLVIFGNESRGISGEVLPFINQRITIPPGNDKRVHVESLNVASSVAIICALLHP
jgi:TrmH family RNA methyltransferase